MCKDSRYNVAAKGFSPASQRAEEPSKMDVACVESFTASTSALSRDSVARESRKNLFEEADLLFLP